MMQSIKHTHLFQYDKKVHFVTSDLTLHNARWSTDRTVIILPTKAALHIYHGHIFSCIIGFLQLSSPWINISLQTPQHCSWSILHVQTHWPWKTCLFLLYVKFWFLYRFLNTLLSQHCLKQYLYALIQS